MQGTLSRVRVKRYVKREKHKVSVGTRILGSSTDLLRVDLFGFFVKSLINIGKRGIVLLIVFKILFTFFLFTLLYYV